MEYFKQYYVSIILIGIGLVFLYVIFKKLKKLLMTKNQIEIKDNILLSFNKELEKVKDNNRSLIVMTHSFIELMFNTIIDNHLKHGKKKITSNNRDYPHSVKLVFLNELSLIDDKLYGILDWFRKLRNRAAHEPIFELTHEELDFAKKSSERFIPGESKNPNFKFYDFCIFLEFTIWNENLDDVLPVFAPNIVNKKIMSQR